MIYGACLLFALLNCVDVPRVKVGPFNPLTVMKGSDAFMTCSVDANPPATKIRWYKNNRLISHELNHTVVNVVPTDSGTFLCVSTHLSPNFYVLSFHLLTYLPVVTNFLSPSFLLSCRSVQLNSLSLLAPSLSSKE